MNQSHLLIARLVAAALGVLSLTSLGALGLAAPAALETRYFRLTIGEDCEILDKHAGVTWRSESEPARLGKVTLKVAGKSQKCESELGGKVLLPPYGFLAESPTFVAFHAKNWAGINYDSPTIFTLRSLDNRPLSRSHNVRIYHAMGNPDVRLGGATQTVPREAVVP